MSLPYLLDRAAAVAAVLAELDVHRNDPVLMMLPDGPGFTESFAGALRACHYNCVSHGWTMIGRCDHHSAGKGTICESGHQCR